MGLMLVVFVFAMHRDGDFLVRETMKNDERQIVLSVFWNGPKHFIVQTTPDVNI